VYDQIFAGIDDSRKPAFAVVPVFADRIDKLQRANDAMSRAALGKLRRRGLTDERIAEARQAFARFRSAESQPLPDLNSRRAKIQAAELALWKYFVEWGQIARAAINEPRLLALLGYGAGTNDDEEQPEPPQSVESATPIALAIKKKRPAARGKKKLRSRSTS